MIIHLSSLCFALMGLVVKHLGTRFQADQISLFRALFPALGLTPLLWREAKKPGFRRVFPIMLLRGMLGSISLICYFKSLLLIDFSNAALLCYTSPIFTAIFARLFLKEPLPGRTLLGLPLAMLGVVCVIQPPLLAGAPLSPRVLQGSLYGLLAGVCAGAAYVSVRKLAATVSPTSIVAVFMWVAVILCLPLVAGHYVPPAPNDWPDLVLMALLATGGQVAMTYGYARYPASQASTMNLSVVVFAALLGVAFLHEPAGGLKLLGLSLTLAGVALVSVQVPAATVSPGSAPDRLAPDGVPPR